MKNLYLGSYEGCTEEEIKQDIVENYLEGKPNDFLEKCEIIIAILTDDYCYSEFSFFLLRKDGKYYENHASHCSCQGFEDQFEPEETTVKYLKSDKFNPVSDYMSQCADNDNDIMKDFIINNIFE